MRGTHRYPHAVQGEPEFGYTLRVELMDTVSPPATTGAQCPPDFAGKSAIRGSRLMIKHHQRSHQEHPGETRA